MHGDYDRASDFPSIVYRSLSGICHTFNSDGLLVTSKLCTYNSAVGSTDFVLKLHVAFI